MPEGKGQIEALIKLRGNILKCKLPSWIHDKPDVKYFYFDTDSEVVSLVQAGYFDYPRFKKLMDSPEDLKQMHVYIRSVAMFMHGEQEDTSDAVDKLILMILMLNEEILCRQELEELLSGAENEIPSVDLDFPTHFSMVDTDEYLKEVLACLKRIGWVEEGTKAEDWIFRLTGRLPEKDMPSQEPIRFLHLNQCRYILKELVFGGMDVSAENYAKAEHVFESLNGSMKNLRSANKKPTGRYEIDKLLKKRRSY